MDKISKRIYCIIKKSLRRNFECNLENKSEINYTQLIELLNNNSVILLDVRSPQEYNEGHLNGAINIPVSELKDLTSSLFNNHNVIIVTYCQVGTRSNKAVKILKNLGYNNVYSLKGGLDAI